MRPSVQSGSSESETWVLIVDALLNKNRMIHAIKRVSIQRPVMSMTETFYSFSSDRFMTRNARPQLLDGVYM